MSFPLRRTLMMMGAASVLDPASFAVLSTLATTREIRDLICSPTLKAIFWNTGNSNEGLRACNVSNPYAMTEEDLIAASSSGSLGQRLGICLSKDIVYGMGGDTVLFDVSDITALVNLDSDTESNTTGGSVTSDGNYLLRLRADTGIRIVDVSADTYGSEHNANHGIGGYTYLSASCFNSDETYGYVADWNYDRIEIYDLTTKTSPAYSGLYTDATNMNNPQRMLSSGDWLFVACRAGDSITILDISTPGTPVYDNKLVDAIELNGADDLVLIDDILYVVCADRITAVDVSDPTAPFVVSSLVDATNMPAPSSICTDGRYLFVGNGSSNKITTLG